ncbi:DUF937 domain-containing protein [Fibrisoma montanum]|uniref:DUF937 domain-containing protein n=1 Tax=Fibrisoma montanum TaxID=2305895 RepID=A0A418M6R5_9BACT|nr:OmpA family protein [Fibrisoma montanum]RIV21554.1 DUF937 domain-containing protein [Fibrisoma montanum]
MNLFPTFNEVLNSDVLSRLALYVDEPTEKTRKAVDALVYTIIGGLMKRTTTEIGVNQLYNHIQKGHYDGSLTDNLVQVLNDPSRTNSLITQGNDVISHLLPAMKSSIGSMISSYAGIRNSSAISLLGLTTTVVLHVLGKQVRERKLDADSLAASLFEQREAFVNIVPEDLMPRLVDKVGIHQVVAGIAAPARRTVTEPAARPTSTVTQSVPASRPTSTATRPAITYEPAGESDDNGSLVKWAVGGLIAAVVIAGGYYIYQNTQNYSNGNGLTDETVVTSDTVQADTVARSLAVPVDSAARLTTPPRAASAVTPTAAAGPASGTLSQQLTPYLGNAALPKGRVFPLSGVAFQPGSLTMTPGSETAVTELATLLKTYPNLQIQLIGYANDARGDLTNKALSFKRVNQIKQQLVSSGINYIRIDAIGRGTGRVRSDSASLNKPALRKIDMRVVVK